MNWRPLIRAPRTRGPLVVCFVCQRTAVNESKALAGWQETVTTRRLYRCDRHRSGRGATPGEDKVWEVR